MTDQAFPQIDGYRISRVIGEGGMSTVYLAEQASLGRKVALKVMLSEALADEVNRARFENEARTIARLEHPHIVGIYEVGRTADGAPFYAMPYLSRGHLAQRRLIGDQPKVAVVLRALLQALDYAHVHGVVHRDVKAENVLFDEADQPLLADFGIALQRGSNPRLTSTGLAVGSTAYMAPEQARGQTVDRRADIYSVGVLAWEMLIGSLPYNAGDALSVAIKHVQEPIPRLPPPLKHWQPFIDKAMAKRPEERFASANEMLAALTALELRSGKNFIAVEVPDFDSAQANPSAGRRWLPIALGLLLLAGGAALLWQNRPVAPAATTPGTPMTDAEPAASLPTPANGAPTGLMVDAVTANPSGIGAYLANAEQQLIQQHLLAPPNANAWDSLEAAWRINPTNPQTLRLTAQLFDALAEASYQALKNGDTATSRLAFERAQELDSRRGGTGAAINIIRHRLQSGLSAGIDASATAGNRDAAEKLLAASSWMGLDAATTRALQARVARITPTAGSGTLTASATAASRNTPQAVALHAVTREEYARFAAATGRAEADCGRRGLFGRKRTWSNTGQPTHAVVCVSASDAQAYARWFSSQSRQHYRLPSAGEAQATNASSGWLTLCADSACSRRMASGKARPLDADRGYPEVGILLVRGR